MLYYLFAINLITFLAFGLDKFKAERDMWRISEKALLSLCVIGGSIGGLAGMYTFRHKTLKPLFKYGVPAILIIQLAAVIIWLK